MRRKNDAVSPVIGTILLVAITVVLTAVLYVMVVGLSGNGNTIVQTPVGSWRSMTPTSTSSAELTFNNIQPVPYINDLMVVVEDENGTIFQLTWEGTTLASEDVNLTCSNANITATYHDFSPSGAMINGGDYITLNGLDPLKYYYVTIFHYPSSSVVQMAGPTSFRTLG